MNYYNDNDPFAARWLRCLIRDGLIPDGDVDERPIQDVEPEDLKRFTQCHFFAGIGGWSRAFQIAGWPTDEPVWTGSCPCQPLSIAGKQQGEKDERHLWPEFYRLISQCRPIRIFGEQSESPDGIEWLDGVSLDLEEIGYAVGSVDLPSAGVGAPNKRQRAWWVAHTNGKGSSSEQIISKQEGCSDTARASSNGYRVADSQHPERRAVNFNRKNGFHREDAGWKKTYSKPRACGEVCRLASANGNGCGKARECIGPTGNDGVDGNSGCRMEHPPLPKGSRQRQQHIDLPAKTSDRLGNTERPGLSVGELRQRSHGKDLEPPQGQGFIQTGFWDQYRIIGGRDGKSRRIPLEPALFPLAPRVPGRVGLLRGAGNAINPWVAAEFIRAYMLAS